MSVHISISPNPLIVQDCLDLVKNPSVGGVDIFVGTVREWTKGRQVNRLDFEAYEPMALLEMEKIATEAMAEFGLSGIVIQHRVGQLAIGEIPVIIAAAAAHRVAAFEACLYAIDTLKKSVPIWKKEIFTDGEVWVSAFP